MKFYGFDVELIQHCEEWSDYEVWMSDPIRNSKSYRIMVAFNRKTHKVELGILDRTFEEEDENADWQDVAFDTAPWPIQLYTRSLGKVMQKYLIAQEKRLGKDGRAPRNTAA